MPVRRAAGPHGHLVALIAAVTVIPLIVLVWLGWRLLDQDRLLQRQQTRQRVERSADLVVSAFQRAVAETEAEFAAGREQWPEGMVAVRFGATDVEARPGGRVAFLPVASRLREAPDEVFADAERREFGQEDAASAIASYVDLTRTGDTAVQAGAYLRLARVLQTSGRTVEALDSYLQVIDADDVAFHGVPAALVARYGRCRLFERLGRAVELHKEAAGLMARLESGHWTLTSPVYWLYSADAARWSGSKAGSPTTAATLATVVEQLWSERSARSAVPPAASRRELLTVDGHAVVVLQQTVNGATSALLVAAPLVGPLWLAALEPMLRSSHITVSLRDRKGVGLTAPLPGGDETLRATRSESDSGLPWTLVAATTVPTPEAQDFAARRRLLVSGLVILVLMASTAGYLVLRAISKEMAVARLQSDFVAAVSHEFRTPLTSLRQFTEMLRDNPALDDDRRRVAYAAQARATERLMRLVESLLDFGGMEAGAHSYTFVTQDLAALVDSVVNDFRSEPGATAAGIESDAAGRVTAAIDADALSRALRNLLDNAVKYSPASTPVRVALRQTGASIRISVQDSGIGIPAREQKAIFSKFQRGEEARSRGIKGTGIGLALVDEIVRAHQGHVELVSEPGRGSTFTIVLPAATSEERRQFAVGSRLTWPES